MSNEFLSFGERILDYSSTSSLPQFIYALRGTTERFVNLARATKAATYGGESEEELSPLPFSTKDKPSTGRTRHEEFSGTGLPYDSVSGLEMPSPPAPKVPIQFETLSLLSTSDTIFTSSLALVQPAPATQFESFSQSFNIQSGRFSSRLGYGLLLNNMQQNSAPAFLWTQYLVAGL